MKIAHRVVVFDAADLTSEPPDGTPPQQIHLDLWVDDFKTAHEQVMALGAKVLQPAGDTSRSAGRPPSRTA